MSETSVMLDDMAKKVTPMRAEQHGIPGPSLYRAVRAGFIIMGDSLSGHCCREGIKRQNARACLLGQWKGPKAAALVRDLCQAAGLVT